MKRFFLTLCLSLVIPGVLYAQEEIELKLDCAAKTVAADSDIEGAEYKPGVDVHGQGVVPADIEPTLEALSYPIEIPVDIDLLNTLDLPWPENVTVSDGLTAEVSRLTIHEDGRVEYNGKDISSKVTVSCVEEENVEKSDGQEEQSSVSSEAENQEEQVQENDE